VHNRFFEASEFEPSASGLRRMLAYCHIAADARRDLAETG
jgi:hypothetical protein